MLPSGTEETVFRAVQAGWIEVRPDGSVWRIAQRRKSRWDGSVTIYPTKPRRIDRAKKGYRTVKIMVDGVQTSTPAHRLVWRTLVGPIPAGLTINHKNGNKRDNRLGNLELATYAEQVRHAREILKVGRLDQNGTRNTMAKLTEKAVREIRRRRKAGERLRAIAADFGISDRTVSKIARGERWAFLG